MAFSLANQVLPGYPNQCGEKMQLVFDHVGPTSYTRYVSATKVGGDVIKASYLGLGGFDNVDDTADTTGQINAIVVVDLGGYGNSTPQFTVRYFSLVTATLGGQSQTLGTEIAAATNLSTFSFRFYCIMV